VWSWVLNVGVTKCDSSKADEMEPAVTGAIKKAGLWGKIVDKVSDGGANLEVVEGSQDAKRMRGDWSQGIIRRHVLHTRLE